MGYVELLEGAEALARKVHAVAVDKAGKPYINHPARVAERLKNPEEKIVGWLHDVVEDTEVSLDEIRDGFGAEIADAVEALTHRKGEMWSDYLCRVKRNPIARAVKISDLIDNSNLARFAEVTERDVKRQAKYNRALYFLMDVDGE